MEPSGFILMSRHSSEFVMGSFHFFRRNRLLLVLSRASKVVGYVPGNFLCQSSIARINCLPRKINSSSLSRCMAFCQLITASERTTNKTEVATITTASV